MSGLKEPELKQLLATRRGGNEMLSRSENKRGVLTMKETTGMLIKSVSMSTVDSVIEVSIDVVVIIDVDVGVDVEVGIDAED